MLMLSALYRLHLVVTMLDSTLCSLVGIVRTLNWFCVKCCACLCAAILRCWVVPPWTSVCVPHLGGTGMWIMARRKGRRQMLLSQRKWTKRKRSHRLPLQCLRSWHSSMAAEREVRKRIVCSQNCFLISSYLSTAGGNHKVCCSS